MRDIWGNIMNRDPLTGKKISKKQIKKEVLAENRRKGKAGEEVYRTNAMLRGVEVERSPKGRDFIERKRDLLTGRVVNTKHIEVKTGKAKLSKLQKKAKKKLKGNYKVERVKPLFLLSLPTNSCSSFWSSSCFETNSSARSTEANWSLCFCSSSSC